MQKIVGAVEDSVDSVEALTLLQSTIAPLILERLKIKPMAWCELATRFGELFNLVAGQPHRVDEFLGRLHKQGYVVPQTARELLSAYAGRNGFVMAMLNAWALRLEVVFQVAARFSTEGRG